MHTTACRLVEKKAGKTHSIGKTLSRLSIIKTDASYLFASIISAATREEEGAAASVQDLVAHVAVCRCSPHQAGTFEVFGLENGRGSRNVVGEGEPPAPRYDHADDRGTFAFLGYGSRLEGNITSSFDHGQSYNHKTKIRSTQLYCTVPGMAACICMMRGGRARSSAAEPTSDDNF
eukprot:GHVU01172713.1.p1 GENE.GHVU01172713.1~~GHVU01172713.1.p1  ORF type:complete len:176 (-),score=13.31 GHVU01172713.1:756-1283(-)